MKRLFFILSVFYLGASGCKESVGKGDVPDKVLNYFLNALASSDISEAKELVTKDSKGMIFLLKAATRLADTSLIRKALSPDNLIIGTPEINEDNANVKVKTHDGGNEVVFYLKKEKDNWKVALDLSTINKMINQQ